MMPFVAVRYTGYTGKERKEILIQSVPVTEGNAVMDVVVVDVTEAALVSVVTTRFLLTLTLLFAGTEK
jgi:hypothetical protein